MVNDINFVRGYMLDLNIPIGHTKRLNCPICNGYKTFTATNNMGMLVWNCYKASCNIKGNTKVRLSVDDIKTAKSQKENESPPCTAFVLPEYIVPHNNRKKLIEFCNTWSLDPTELDLHYDVKEDRVVFLIKDGNKVVDATGRALTSRLPKWKRYGNNTLPYYYGSGTVGVVVEDCVSAARVGGKAYVGVAILGTSLSEEHKDFLSRFSTIIIALDPDAMPKIFAFAKELRGYVNNIKVLRLTDDLKYYNKKDITNLYNLTPKE